MAVHVTPDVAKKGDYLESFRKGEEPYRDEFCAKAEAMLVQNNIHGKAVVYTFMPEWGRRSQRYATWQVFMVDEGT